MIFKIILPRSVQTPNSDKNWQTSCPLQTFVCNISRHLEFVIEQGHRVNWVSGSLDSRVTGSQHVTQFHVCHGPQSSLEDQVGLTPKGQETGVVRSSSRPRHTTGLPTVESDLAPMRRLTSYHRAQNRRGWSVLVGKQHPPSDEPDDDNDDDVRLVLPALSP